MEQRIGMSVDMSSKLDKKSKKCMSEMARRKDSPVTSTQYIISNTNEISRYA